MDVCLMRALTEEGGKVAGNVEPGGKEEGGDQAYQSHGTVERDEEESEGDTTMEEDGEPEGFIPFVVVCMDI